MQELFIVKASGTGTIGCWRVNPLKPSGYYMYRLLEQAVALHFFMYGFAWFSVLTVIISLNSINQLIFVMVKCGVLFEVRTEFLILFRRSSALKG
jgi:hypothetical protein